MKTNYNSAHPMHPRNAEHRAHIHAINETCKWLSVVMVTIFIFNL